MQSTLSRFNSSRNAVLLALTVTLGALLRFYAIGNKGVWLDEAFSIWVANLGIVESWRWLVRIDQHPPLYYSLLSVWQWLFGDMQGPVRAFSALCSTLAIPFVYLAAKRITRDSVAGLIAALVLAVSPFHVRFAQEARMYALLTLLASIAIFCAVRYLDGDGTRRLGWRDYLFPRRWARLGDVRAAVGLSFFQATMMLTHNTAAVFFPLALNLAVFAIFIYRRQTGRYVTLRAVNAERFLRNWLVIQAVALLLWLPWLVPFAIQSMKVDQEFWIAAPDFDQIWGTLRNFNFAHLPGWVPDGIWMLLYWTLAIAGVVFLRRKLAWALLLLSLMTIPFAGELLVSLRRPIFSDRTLIWTTLPYYMLIAFAIRGLMIGPFARRWGEPLTPPPGRRLRRAGAALALLIIVGFSVLSLFTYYAYFEKEDWAKAADYVAQEIKPGDMILFNATWVQIPFEYYFRHHSIDADLHGAPVDLFDRGVLEPKMTESDVDRLTELVADDDQVWLVYSHNWYTDPEQIVPRELRRLMRQTGGRSFVGLQVIEFER